MSLHEVSTAFFYEELHISREKGAVIVTISTLIIGAICSLSLGEWNFLSLSGKNLFSIFDFVTGQIFLPLGGFLTCIFLGWYVPKDILKSEFTNWETLKGTFFGMFLFLIRFVCPISILAIFLHQFNII